MDELIAQIREWQVATFEDEDLQSVRGKLQEESRELVEASQCGGDNLADEIGDVMHVLVAMAGLHEIDLFEATKAKLQKNKTREWLKNKHGIYSHKKG